MSALTIDQSLELQRWILDPSSRPEKKQEKQQEKLVARSAGEYVTYKGTTAEPKCNVQKQLELQRMIVRE
jgi:hypothetical protein